MATSLLNTLKLVAATRDNKVSPEMQRRQKLIKKIDEQILLAHAALNGETSIYGSNQRCIKRTFMEQELGCCND